MVPRSRIGLTLVVGVVLGVWLSVLLDREPTPAPPCAEIIWIHPEEEPE